MTLKTDSSLKVWFPTNEGTGNTLYDYSSTIANATCSNHTWSKNKNGKNSISYNGSNTTTSFTLTNNQDDSYTVAFWAKPLSSSTNNFVRWSAQTSVYQCYITVGSTTISFHSDSTNSSDTNRDWVETISDVTGKWIFVVGTMENRVRKLYLNGVYLGSKASDWANLSWTGSHVIGKFVIENYYTTGIIGEFFIFNRALNLNEINDLYKKTYIE